MTLHSGIILDNGRGTLWECRVQNWVDHVQDTFPILSTVLSLQSIDFSFKGDIFFHLFPCIRCIYFIFSIKYWLRHNHHLRSPISQLVMFNSAIGPLEKVVFSLESIPFSLPIFFLRFPIWNYWLNIKYWLQSC